MHLTADDCKNSQIIIPVKNSSALEESEKNINFVFFILSDLALSQGLAYKRLNSKHGK